MVYWFELYGLYVLEEDKFVDTYNLKLMEKVGMDNTIHLKHNFIFKFIKFSNFCVWYKTK